MIVRWLPSWYQCYSIGRVSKQLPGALLATSNSLWQEPAFPNSRTYASTARPAISKLLVANRGEIACRVIISARRLGIPTVAVYSEADLHSKHVELADESYCIGPPPARDSYLQGSKILDVARKSGSSAVHPGYGFLSENAKFADSCKAAGVTFVGPPASAIRAMGDKSEAKDIMGKAGVPVVPGYHGRNQDEVFLLQQAGKIGFPLLVKAVAGGGGKGMKLATSQAEVADALSSAKREAAASFGNDQVLLERYIERPRHVEVQVFTDTHGGGVYLFDRDCSVQRRHQKIIEEAPAPGLDPQFHTMIGEAAVRAARAAGYVNAGTVEFIVDTDTQDFYFMEMNTRLQVEHPVSEAITQQDLVEWQLRVAAGEALPLRQDQLRVHGHAFEARLYAESPLKQFLPGGGQVRRWRTPPSAVYFSHVGSDVRVDSGVRPGDSVGTNYDPMIAKVIARGATREEALQRMRACLADTQVAGLPTNVTFLQRLCEHPAFINAELDTSFIKKHAAQLLHVPRPAPHVVAMAAVARFKLKALELQRTYPTPAVMGPWAIADGKRLWHHLTRPYRMSLPDAGQDLDLRLTLLSESDFDVEGAADASSGNTDTRSSIHASSSSSAAGPVLVRGAQLHDGERLVAEVDGRRMAADVLLYSTAAEEVLTLWLDGQAHEFRWPIPRWSKDAQAVARHGEVTAPMPGKIVKLLVTEGQRVVAGQALLVMEAMKMEHAVAASAPGVVSGLGVSVGSQVEDGQVLLSIDKEQAMANPGVKAGQ